MNLEWLGHAGFKITNGVVVYIDPYNISGGPEADIIFITHDHFDHCSPSDIEKIRGEKTTTVCPEGCNVPGDIRIVTAGDNFEIKDVGVEVVPAYNIDKKFHPKDKGFVGYVITIDGQRIYHAGDTDLIPEMSEVECDTALLPVSGTYVMTAKEAAGAASQIKTKLVIPMHYGGGVVGTEDDALEFERLSNVPVEIKTKGD
jgi:L-ascorbate metabolism protein UlaG (beta-lactamase superfamily)